MTDAKFSVPPTTMACTLNLALLLGQALPLLLLVRLYQITRQRSEQP